MSTDELPKGMTQAAGTGIVPGYIPGFGKDFETEALPHSMACPQKFDVQQRLVQESFPHRHCCVDPEKAETL